jgi:hypothetical protein
VIPSPDALPEHIAKLIDQGLVEEVYDPTFGEVRYRLTRAGRDEGMRILAYKRRN